MLINTCITKIHRATVTNADLNYIGSITIDRALLKASGMKPYQMVQITNCSNGILWRTYIMEGEEGKGEICLNGPPARHFQVGDKVIILAEAYIDPEKEEAKAPTIVFVDENNKITGVKKE